MTLTAIQLRNIVPSLNDRKADMLVLHLNEAMEWAEINTLLRISAFIAQIAHETGEFKWTKELGDKEYFKRYEGKVSLGNIFAGDGFKYLGRGFIQITGRYNYDMAGKAIGVDLIHHPELAETYQVGAKIAAWYWKDRKINELADKDDFKGVTRKINGGLNGYENRKKYYIRAKETL